MITVRITRRKDIPQIVKLYNLVVDVGGYARTRKELNRHITKQDWEDWSKHFDFVVNVVFERDGEFYGNCVCRDADEDEILIEHLNVFNRAGPDADVFLALRDYLLKNTKFTKVVADRKDITNRANFDRIGKEINVPFDEHTQLWRQDIAKIGRKARPDKRKTKTKRDA